MFINSVGNKGNLKKNAIVTQSNCLDSDDDEDDTRDSSSTINTEFTENGIDSCCCSKYSAFILFIVFGYKIYIRRESSISLLYFVILLLQAVQSCLLIISLCSGQWRRTDTAKIKEFQSSDSINTRNYMTITAAIQLDKYRGLFGTCSQLHVIQLIMPRQDMLFPVPSTLNLSGVCLAEDKFECRELPYHIGFSGAPVGHQFLKTCIEKEKLCDGHIDCWNGEDEANCPSGPLHVTNGEHCPKNYRRCPSINLCVPNDNFCDGANSCGNLEDENNCTQCHGSVECENHSCRLGNRCDGNIDCGQDIPHINKFLSSDEYNCSKTECELCEKINEENFKYSACISEGERCNGIPNCRGFEDEKDCIDGTFDAVHNCTYQNYFSSLKYKMMSVRTMSMSYEYMKGVEEFDEEKYISFISKQYVYAILIVINVILATVTMLLSLLIFSSLLVANVKFRQRLNQNKFIKNLYNSKFQSSNNSRNHRRKCLDVTREKERKLKTSNNFKSFNYRMCKHYCVNLSERKSSLLQTLSGILAFVSALLCTVTTISYSMLQKWVDYSQNLNSDRIYKKMMRENKNVRESLEAYGWSYHLNWVSAMLAFSVRILISFHKCSYIKHYRKRSLIVRNTLKSKTNLLINNNKLNEKLSSMNTSGQNHLSRTVPSINDNPCRSSSNKEKPKKKSTNFSLNLLEEKQFSKSLPSEAVSTDDCLFEGDSTINSVCSFRLLDDIDLNLINALKSLQSSMIKFDNGSYTPGCLGCQINYIQQCKFFNEKRIEEKNSSKPMADE
ncbi:hypothetical protein SNEBB_004365 [Seison nebaliae]|nr:hypothetical protein SNEBB_004365 [Seison nebaliae]